MRLCSWLTYVRLTAYFLHLCGLQYRNWYVHVACSDCRPLLWIVVLTLADFQFIQYNHGVLYCLYI